MEIDRTPVTSPAAAVERSVELDADVDAVLELVADTSSWASWLGTWEADDRDGRARVTTDDGVTRVVERFGRTEGTVTWRWTPEGDPDEVSEVHIEVAPLDDGRSRMTVREVMERAGAGASSTAVPSFAGWVAVLLVLQVLVALRSDLLVAV